MKKGISVLVAVHNEESRIGAFLKSFAWSDELVVVDKSSTDRTAELVRASGARHVLVPYADGVTPQMNDIAQSCRNEWIWFVTASDLVHPQLVRTALELINREDFAGDVIEYPFIYYVFGLRDRRSPWPPKYRGMLCRKSLLTFQDVVHKEAMVAPAGRRHRLPFHDEHAMHHLTHETLNTFFERHHRYAQLEVARVAQLDGPAALKKSAGDVWRSLKFVALDKKSWRLGWNGVALGLAYISYFIFVFLYVWQEKMGRGSREYRDIRRRYEELWRDEKPG